MARKSKLEVTAYHEAGHAVVSLALGRAVGKVTVIPDADLDSEGACHPLRPGLLGERLDAHPHPRAWCEREIMILLAGGTAEALFKGHRRALGDNHDVKAAYGLALKVTSDVREAEAYLAWLKVRVENILTSPGEWAAVEAVAKALLERKELRGREVKGIFESAQRVAA